MALDWLRIGMMVASETFGFVVGMCIGVVAGAVAFLGTMNGGDE